MIKNLDAQHAREMFEYVGKELQPDFPHVDFHLETSDDPADMFGFTLMANHVNLLTPIEQRVLAQENLPKTMYDMSDVLRMICAHCLERAHRLF